MYFSPTDIVNEAQDYVTELFHSLSTRALFFHNLDHTKSVVKGAQIIGFGLQLSPKEQEILLLAAWFHDTGFLVSYHLHENHSMQIAEGFLKDLDFPAPCIQMVLDCIDATRMPQEPKTPMQMVLCDADMYHLSQSGYCEVQELLRQEWQVELDQTYTDQEWHQQNLQFLENHRYFTDYGQRVLEKKKKANILECRQLHLMKFGMDRHTPTE